MPGAIITIRPFQEGWKVLSGSVETYFVGPTAIEHAIDFARAKIKSFPGEVQLLARNGETNATLSFENRDPRDDGC